MKLNEQDVVAYRRAMRSPRRARLLLLAYSPIWIVWMVLIDFYEWPRTEVSLPIAILVFLGAAASGSDRNTIKLLEKLGSDYPELSEKSDFHSLPVK
jgi:4-hydroxybenzoate polyprenyltransferase